MPYGLDNFFKSSPVKHCYFVHISNETVDLTLDQMLEAELSENSFGDMTMSSIEDKHVLKQYKASVKNIGNRFQIGLPFKKPNVTLITA